MRPDTPQNYEYISIEDITGRASNFIYVKPWTQFFDLKGREDIPVSYSSHVAMRNITLDCDNFFNVDDGGEQYKLSHFAFENLNITAKNGKLKKELVKDFTLRNVRVNGVEVR